MLDLLKYLDARLGEPGTWASIAAMLVLAHVSVDPGTWHVITAYGIIIAGLLGVVLREIGNKPPMQIANDVAQALLVGLKMLVPADPQPAAVGSVGPSVPVHVVGTEPAPSPSPSQETKS